MIMHTKVKACWDSIHAARKKSAVDSTAKENKKRIDHQYSINDLVLILPSPGETRAKLRRPTAGPFKIIEVYTNGTVKIQRGRYTETINIRRLKPYNERKVRIT